MESPSRKFIEEEPVCGISITSDKAMPTTVAGMAMISPMAGPMIPMSNKAFRSGILPPIFIMAPKVPKGGNGEGMK